MKRGILAFLGDGLGADALDAFAIRTGMRRISPSPGLALYAGESIADRLMPDGAILLGEIFSLPGTACRSPADGWGDYLAFARTAAGWRVDRAPLTGMPLYWIEWQGGILCTSHLDPVIDLFEGVRIDADFVSQALVYVNLRTERTGISGLFELLPGMRLEQRARGAHVRRLWSPWDHVATVRTSAMADLAIELERRLIEAVRAWSATRSDILLELSGGLDSSIVAAALSGAGADFAALTFVTPGADGDERIYARAVAAHLGIELIEVALDPSDIDLVAPPAILGSRPGAYSVLRGIDHGFDRAVGARALSVFGGTGGDNIFAFDGSVSPFLDAVAAFGPSRRAFSVLRDVARGGGATLWEAARFAWQA